jgi:cephalosporin-C deacetylase-like acetyl esterase
MKTKHLILIIIGVFVATAASAQSPRALAWSNSTAYNAYLMRQVHQQYAGRPAPDRVDPAALRAKYQQILGTFPRRGDLKAQITGTLQGKGFRIEKILFQSLPGRYVTANLYLPEGITTPVPAALELCGHGLRGKGYLSGAALLLAANGIAVMVVDPIGQGERLQLIDTLGNPLTRGATTEHTLLNAGLNLIGTSLAAQEAFDNSRALDYLCSRPDIDAGRLGAYGSSGGGTQTTYLIGMDERVQCAAICSFFSSRERTLELMGPSDGCQHIPYEGREQLDLSDFALMMAPRPVLILSGKYDFVDLWGAQQEYARLHAAYTALGHADKTDLLVAECGHGMPPVKQERLAHWFVKQLLGKEGKLKPRFTGFFSSEQLACTDKGQVNLAFGDACSLMDEMTAAARACRHAPTRGKLLELLGIDPDKRAALRIDATGHSAGRGYEQYHFQLVREGEMPVPCILLVPETATKESSVRLVLREEGKAAWLQEFTNLTAALTDGTLLLAADLRGMGETADPPFYNDAKYWNTEYRNAMISMHIGRPIMGQRVTDLLTLLDFCDRHETLRGRTVNIQATGRYGPVVMHAACLDKRIGSALITGSIRSWESYLSNPMQRDMYSNVLYGALQTYDLPDLIRMSKGRVRFGD